MKSLTDAKIPFMRVDDFEDFKKLRKLEKRLDTGKFELLVATYSSTMLGSDFRAKDTGMTLIVAKSFNSDLGA
jgi:hypothetical protein